MSLSKEEMDERKGRITSSVIYDVQHNPFRAWTRIMQLEDPKAKAALEKQENIKFGNEAEEVVRGVAANRLGLAHAKARFRPHPEHDWAGDSTDASFTEIASGKLVAIGEVKTHGSAYAGAYGDDGSEQIPERIEAQCRWHLIHWPEVDVCYAIAFTAKHELRLQIHPVKRDASKDGQLWEAAKKFHRDHIATNTPPPLDGTDDSKHALISRYRSPGEAMVTAGELVMGDIERRRALKAKLKPLEAELKGIDNRIKDAIGNGRGLIYGGKTVARYVDVKATVINRAAYKQLRCM